MRTEITTSHPNPGLKIQVVVSDEVLPRDVGHITFAVYTGAATVLALMSPKDVRALARALIAATLEAERAQLHAEAREQVIDGVTA